MSHTAYLVAGLGFGDEGKGSIVDYLVRTTGAKLVVRYNGGPQAAHNVVLPDGRHHTFSQFGSGTLAGADTYLSPFMMVEPYAMINEAEVLNRTYLNSLASPKFDVFETLWVDEDCPIITPYHWKANRIRETIRGDGCHGSCGMGIGELKDDILMGRPFLKVGDLLWHTYLNLKSVLKEIQRQKLDSIPKGICTDSLEEPVENVLSFYQWNFLPSIKHIIKGAGSPKWLSTKLKHHPVVFEGAQGMLLDQTYGFAPYHTWTNISFKNAFSLLRDSGVSGEQNITRVGVLRTYPTRHGPGPFPTWDPALTFPDHNCSGPWQGPFRQGYFDLPMTRYALNAIGGVDYIALTHLDYLQNDQLPYTSHYTTADGNALSEIPHAHCADLLFQVTPKIHWKTHYKLVLQSLGVRIGIESKGPTTWDKCQHLNVETPLKNLECVDIDMLVPTVKKQAI